MLIGITGKRGAGKTTVSNILMKNYGFARMKFSHPLKAMIKHLGLTEEQLEDRSKELPVPFLNGVTPRRLMQTLGTEWGRNLIDPDLWCLIMRNKLQRLYPPESKGTIGVNIVVDDVRFMNEVMTLESFPCHFFWDIRRGGLEPSTHPSETSLDDTRYSPDHVIDNYSTLENLHRMVTMAHNICLATPI